MTLLDGFECLCCTLFKVMTIVGFSTLETRTYFLNLEPNLWRRPINKYWNWYKFKLSKRNSKANVLRFPDELDFIAQHKGTDVIRNASTK